MATSMRHLRIGVLLATLLGVPAITACSHASGGASPRAAPLEGTRWVLAEIGGNRAAMGLDDEPVTLQLDRAVRLATGYAGVNRFSGVYDLDGASLRFGPLATTRRAGPPEAESLETAVLAALAAVSGWKVTGESLELLDHTGSRLMRFDAAAAPR